MRQIARSIPPSFLNHHIHLWQNPSKRATSCQPARLDRDVPRPRHCVQPRSGARLGSQAHPALAEALRRRRRGKAGRSWYVDETYVKVQGRWCYLYRAIDTSGALVDVRLSETRDMAAAKAFFRSAKMVTGITPARVTTDGHDSYPRAIRTELGEVCAIGPISISTTGSNRIIAASKADTNQCAGSRVLRALRGSVEVTTNCETSSASDQTATNVFPPITADACPLPIPYGDQYPEGSLTAAFPAAQNGLHLMARALT